MDCKSDFAIHCIWIIELQEIQEKKNHYNRFNIYCSVAWLLPQFIVHLFVVYKIIYNYGPFSFHDSIHSTDTWFNYLV